MAITSRPGAESAARVGTRVGSIALGASGIATAIASLLAPDVALAAKWSIDSGVSSDATWTSNAALGQTGTPDPSGNQRDVIFELRPYLRFTGEGDRLKIKGSVAMSGLLYANDSQPKSLLPEADIDAKFEAIKNFMFIDAGFRALQTSGNTFGARTEAGTRNANTLTTTETHVSPSIEGGTGDTFRYRLRSDNSWTTENGTDDALTSSNAAGYYGLQSALIEHDPKPTGWRIEAQRSQTRYTDDNFQSVTIDLARAGVGYAVTPDLVLGVHGGAEHESFDTDNASHAIYGIDASWKPSPRTTVTVFEEKRFFGKGWNLTVDHRSPFVAFNLTSSRTLQTSAQALFDLPATENVAALLDASFTTRYPDPVERARVVQDFIARQGLPASSLQPISLQTARLSLVTTQSATVAFIGQRNSLSLTAFSVRTQDAPNVDDVLLTNDPQSNNKQVGASVSLSHRLTPRMVFVASTDWSRTTALDPAVADRTTQKTARVRVNLEVSPKTTVYAGARYIGLDSNIVTSGREGALFVGANHRF